MRAVRMEAVGEPLRLVTVEEPEPGPRDAILKVSACGVCRSDWHLWQGDWSWEGIALELPRILGHEAGGIVRGVGEEVTTVAPGMSVCVPFHEACGRCPVCLSGRTQICPSAEYLGSTHDGAFAELVRIVNADVNCIPLPSGVAPVAAAELVANGTLRPGELVTRELSLDEVPEAIHSMSDYGLTGLVVASSF